MSRYDANGPESEFEPGSDGRVLANKLHIVSPDEIDDVELQLLRELYGVIMKQEFPDRTLTVEDLKRWHRKWLGNVYEWAGRERSVNMTKGEFTFAAAAQIPRLLEEFDTNCLEKYTPCYDLDFENLAMAIAATHVEFILIHPFREGNGRLARMLADVMAVQAGCDPLDYSVWDADKERYFTAVQDGLGQNYEPMAELVKQAFDDPGRLE